MTVEEKLEAMLVECGMFDEQAIRVIEKTKELKCNGSMMERWQHDWEDYQSPLLAVLWLSVRKVALEDIDANCPKAWFRPMFTTKEATT